MKDYSKFNLTLKNLFEFQKIKKVLVGDLILHNVLMHIGNDFSPLDLYLIFEKSSCKNQVVKIEV